MPAGKVTGREVKAAFARSSSWGVPASVTRQIYLQETGGLDTVVGMVDDMSFNQNFLLAGEVGDHQPLKRDLPMQMRYETIDTWLAAACGSAAAPTVVSSQAANSLVAYQHIIDLAPAIFHQPGHARRQHRQHHHHHQQGRALLLPATHPCLPLSPNKDASQHARCCR